MKPSIRRGRLNSRWRNSRIANEVTSTTASGVKIDRVSTPSAPAVISGQALTSIASVAKLPVSAERIVTSLIAPKGAVAMFSRPRAQA